MAAALAPVAPTVIAVPTSQVVVTTGLQSPSMPTAIKKQKTAGKWNDTGLYVMGQGLCNEYGLYTDFSLSFDYGWKSNKDISFEIC